MHVCVHTCTHNMYICERLGGGREGGREREREREKERGGGRERRTISLRPLWQTHSVSQAAQPASHSEEHNQKTQRIYLWDSVR